MGVRVLSDKSKEIAREKLSIVGNWVARETRNRKCTEEELKELSESLKYLKEYLQE